ncbi:MAG: hypothetical protein R3F61_18175 [Myxococcota bacterium]
MLVIALAHLMCFAHVLHLTEGEHGSQVAAAPAQISNGMLR